VAQKKWKDCIIALKKSNIEPANVCE